MFVLAVLAATGGPWSLTTVVAAGALQHSLVPKEPAVATAWRGRLSSVEVLLVVPVTDLQ